MRRTFWWLQAKKIHVEKSISFVWDTVLTISSVFVYSKSLCVCACACTHVRCIHIYFSLIDHFLKIIFLFFENFIYVSSTLWLCLSCSRAQLPLSPFGLSWNDVCILCVILSLACFAIYLCLIHLGDFSESLHDFFGHIVLYCRSR